METTVHSKVSPAKSQRNKIAILNDQFRMTGLGGKMLMTRGVANLGEEMQIKIFSAVRGYSAWSEDNDPYGEHDFGIITLESKKIYFKIDYYDIGMKFGSEDPADPKKTTRVLTMMLAEEY